MSRPRPEWAPPAREGLNASCVATPHGHWPSLRAFLAWRLPAVSESDWQARMAQGDVLDAQGRPVSPDAPFQGGRRYWYWRDVGPETPVPFEATVLYRDDHLLVVDKPHFLPMTPKGRHVRETLLVRLQQQLGLQTLAPIHRLDRETAGVVAFSVRPADRAAYQALFRDRRVHKLYEAVAGWQAAHPLTQVRESRLVPSERFMQVCEQPGGPPNAWTRIERLATDGPRALYRLFPRTGQTHQLRVHMNALGLPLEGDRIYPVLQPLPESGARPDWRQPLQLLARALAFTDPITGRSHLFQSQRRLDWHGPLPEAVQAVPPLSAWLNSGLD